MFSKIKFRLFLVYSIFVGITALMGSCFLYFQHQRELSYAMIHRIHNVSYQIFSLNNVEQSFVHYDSRKPTYHFTHTSANIKKHQLLIEEIKHTIEGLLTEPLLNDNEPVLSQLKDVLLEIDNYNRNFHQLVTTIEVRGTQIYGLEGELKQTQFSVSDTLQTFGHIMVKVYVMNV